jgi:hypothetical protein
MGKYNHYSVKKFIEAIPGTGGIISAIAKKVGCSWHTAKKYIRTYATIRQAYNDECEAILDMAEQTLLKSIKEGNTGDARWYLARKGRKRGYILETEIKQDVTSGGEPIIGNMISVISHDDDGDD